MVGLGRLVYYRWGKAAVWQLIFVDDLLWLAWKKFVRGPEFTWFGVRGGALGLSESRAAWAINWLG